ncbi:MAG: rRNA maturation RNase YbeY, partial [Ignavibacteria bacterium GWB2_35_6b]
MIKKLSVYASKNFTINKPVIHKIVASLKDELGFSISSLQYNFVSPEEIHTINKKYLKHDFTTDIITFNYSGKNDILEGEIFISVEDARQNSKKFKV